MKVYRGIESFNAHRPVVTIGTFDGVHNGHREVVKQLKNIAQKEQGETVIFTFDPHPRRVVAPDDTSLRLLSTTEEKIALFEGLGIDHLVVYPFTKEFAQLKYDEFIQQILVDKLKMAHLVVGYDHKFGRNREGGFEFLKECANKLNFGISQLKVLSMNDTNISSTEIRGALNDGDIVKANGFLGYSYGMKGLVVKGQQIGRTIDFPTANIQVNDSFKIIPSDGVYAVWAEVEGIRYKGMLNIGSRPTVNNDESDKSIEVHLFDFNQDIYQKEMNVFFVDKIRNEQKFKSVDELKDQLEKDRLTAKGILVKLGI
ncbi:bifunctional riboflavin kinase/FAD synthetase [Prolixibacteraceae bacterium JC049]|nr:bifunctional riboflavin kinase/FAD synthetase [Prolixibacteraceae bacterium JC049]